MICVFSCPVKNSQSCFANENANHMIYKVGKAILHEDNRSYHVNDPLGLFYFCQNSLF